MKFFRTRAFVAVMSFAAGMATMYAWQLKRMISRLDGVPQWQPSPFGSEDPFDRADRLHKQLLEEMQKQTDSFGEEPPGGNLEVSEIKENEKEYFFEVDTRAMPGAQVSVQVDPGQLTLTAQAGGESPGFQATVQKSFSIPEDVDANLVELENSKDKVVVHLPKKK